MIPEDKRTLVQPNAPPRVTVPTILRQRIPMQVSRFSRDLVRGFAPITVVIVLAGCGAEMPTSPEVQGWELVGGGRGRTVTNPEEYMIAVGCSVFTGSSDSTVMAIKPIDGPAQRFRCAGVRLDTVRAAMTRYVSATQSANGNASLLLGSWDVVSREYCYASAGWWQADGSYYLPSEGTLYDCFWEETWTYIPQAWPGFWNLIPIAPGGGGGTPTPTVDSTLVDPPRPGDIEPAWWDRLNRDEKWRCAQNVLRCGVIGVYATYASEFGDSAAIANNASNHNTVYDGYRHSLLSALIAQEFEPSEAIWWGDTHEKYRPAAEQGEVCMDKHNNAVGRGITASFNGVYKNLGQLKQAVVSAEGQLWATPGCP